MWSITETAEGREITMNALATPVSELQLGVVFTRAI
jgi:hypothetical protein